MRDTRDHPAARSDAIRRDPPALSSATLAELERAIAGGRLPPVDQWEPAHCGHSDMRIAADGTWFHAGTPIGRPALVRLFARVLRREADGRHVLVTPAEKLTIDVDDAPFVAVEMRSDGVGPARRLFFRLNTDEIVAAGPDHPISIAMRGRDEPRPYLRVRGSAERPLHALIARSVFYELAEIALKESQGSQTGVWSGGAFFAFPAG